MGNKDAFKGGRSDLMTDSDSFASIKPNKNHTGD